MLLLVPVLFQARLVVAASPGPFQSTFLDVYPDELEWSADEWANEIHFMVSGFRG
jgi:hypothetical protein